MSTFFEFILRHLTWIAAFAAGAVVIHQINARRRQQDQAREILSEAQRLTNHEPLSLHPEIDPNLCSGCGACSRACPEGDVLRLVDHRAILVNPLKCIGHGECERACPMNAIQLVFGTKTRGVDIPRLNKNYETNVPGLYIAGELGGMGLIRNAVKQGAMAAEHALRNLGPEPAKCDLVIVGAGPAGFSAALAAIAAGRSYLLIEQNKFGGTIANFPRQKLVLSHPIQLPLVGQKRFPLNEVPKDGLITYWEQVRAKTGLKVKEGTKFEGVEKVGGVFHVRTSQGSITAKKVILAMGVRGSARKLGVPGEELSKVTYELIEPQQYQRRRIIVVGGGNSAIEAAVMLADPRLGNKVLLLVRGSSLDRGNEANLRRLNALTEKALVEVWLNSQIETIAASQVQVSRAGASLIVKNDFVFIFAGAEMPRAFLMSLGVKIDKLHGQRRHPWGRNEDSA